jgi:U3 small nucleolar RNA-associated protein MPP10
LLQIYEEEFLLRSAGASKKVTEVNASVELIKGLYHKVCRELDALSHFHYTPRPVVAEPIVTGLPSIAMEELLPFAESTNSTSAPEQVQEKKSGRAAAYLAPEELDRGDKRRLRQASKAVRRKQRRLADSEERLIAKINPGAGNKYEAKKALEELRNDRRVVQGRGDSKGFGKSSEFFSALQQQTQQDIASKKRDMHKIQDSVVPVLDGASKRIKL